jgi:hypothetical protein
MRRYPLVGGFAAWRVPLLTMSLALGGVALDAWGIAVGVVVLGWVGQSLWRSVVIELSPDGLARGLRLDGVFIGRTVSLSWNSVVAVETDWWEPDDHRALETFVRGLDGTTIRISTTMGLQSYWACLAEIVRQAPGAVRPGLTDATLAGGPPARGDVIAAAKTAGALALIPAAMIAVCYVWAQGRSSLARDLEETAASPLSLGADCPDPRGVAGWPPPGCRPRENALRVRGR